MTSLRKLCEEKFTDGGDAPVESIVINRKEWEETKNNFETDVLDVLSSRQAVVTNMSRGLMAKLTMEDMAFVWGEIALSKFRKAMQLYEEQFPGDKIIPF